MMNINPIGNAFLMYGFDRAPSKDPVQVLEPGRIATDWQSVGRRKGPDPDAALVRRVAGDGGRS